MLDKKATFTIKQMFPVFMMTTANDAPCQVCHRPLNTCCAYCYQNNLVKCDTTGDNNTHNHCRQV